MIRQPMMGAMTAAEELAGQVRAARDGSLDALGQLYTRMGDSVYAVALRITASPADAEDVLQDVFVGLPRALRRYTERDRFDPWLKKVAARTALMRLRSRGRRREAPLEEAGPLAAAGDLDPADGVLLERLVAALPDRLRIVFVLKEIEGFSHAEIAGMIGISQGNSAVRLNRAWAALRRRAGIP